MTYTPATPTDNYSSTLGVVRATGIGVEVKNENVGTGTGTASSFDLDNGNVIASSYTLKYAASGSNSFTSLTETTHYTIDKDGGTIELTTAGKTALSTNILYADYIHSPKMSDTIIATYLNRATEEVERATGKCWGTPAERINYFDGKNSRKYADTDKPYASDRDKRDRLQLDRGNVTEVSNVYFLARGTGLSDVLSYDASETEYTDNTGEANTPGGTDFYVWAATPATSDIIYFGSAYKFHGLTTQLGTVGVGSSETVTWEYYDGSSWTSFTPTELTTNASTFEASGRITWSALSSWTKVSVNSGTSLYFVRARLAAGSYTTSPKMTHCAMDQDSVVDEEIPLYSIDWTSSGEVTLLNDWMPEGERNVKVVFKHGQAATNPLIGELEELYCGLRVYANITGGSYDDETGLSIGRFQVSIGEVYVNVKEVARQFQDRIDNILTQVGRRVRVGVI